MSCWSFTLGLCFLVGNSDFLESCRYCEVARCPVENPGGDCAGPRNSPAHNPP